MATNADLIRCANPACKCQIEPTQEVCSDYCASAVAWKADEVQTDVCMCGHPACTGAAR